MAPVLHLRAALGCVVALATAQACWGFTGCPAATVCKSDAVSLLPPVPVGYITQFTATSADDCASQCKGYPFVTYYEYTVSEFPLLSRLPAWVQYIFRKTNSCFCYPACYTFQLQIPNAPALPTLGPLLDPILARLAKSVRGFTASCK